MCVYRQLLKLWKVSEFPIFVRQIIRIRLGANAYSPPASYELSVNSERIGISNWLIASRMASTVALWLSSCPYINSSVYSGIKYKK